MNTKTASSPQPACPITLKKLHISRQLSEETIAYSAEVYWSGRKIGYIHNDGHGGSSCLTPAIAGRGGDFDAAQTYAKAQEHDYGAGLGVLPFDNLEDFVDHLVFEEQCRQDDLRWLKRNLKTKTVVFSGGQILTAKVQWTGDTDRIERLIRKQHPDAIILNTLTLEEALVHYQSVPAE